MSALVVLCTAPSEETAGAIARALVDERLAACVNIVPRVRSIYRCQGAVQDEAESLLLIKTTAARLDALWQRLPGLHPYAVPEGLALPVHAGLAPYLAWLVDQTAPSDQIRSPT